MPEEQNQNIPANSQQPSNEKLQPVTPNNPAPIPLSPANVEIYRLARLIVITLGIPAVAYSFQTTVSENTLLMIIALMALVAAPDLLSAIPTIFSSAKKIITNEKDNTSNNG